jgi:hypothetical protein
MLDRSPSTYFPRQWEFRTVCLLTQASDAQLNEWSEDGWECFSINPAAGGKGWNHSLKRLVESGPKIERRVRM